MPEDPPILSCRYLRAICRMIRYFSNFGNGPIGDASPHQKLPEAAEMAACCHLSGVRDSHTRELSIGKL